jgi:hypothetical protein
MWRAAEGASRQSPLATTDRECVEPVSKIQSMPDEVSLSMSYTQNLVLAEKYGRMRDVFWGHFGDNTGHAKPILVQSKINVVLAVSYGVTTTSNVSPTLPQDSLNVAIQG